MEHDSLAERGRALEEEYFRKKDRELVEKMRLAASADEARARLGEATGLSDPAVLQELQELGFTGDTVRLVPLVPVVQMAWAEGGVSARERELLVQIARRRGIEEGSPADRQLSAWMAQRPAEAVFASAGRLIRALLEAGGSPVASGLTADDLVHQAEQIAAASGGILGIGRVSAEERALLSQLAQDLKGRKT